MVTFLDPLWLLALLALLPIWVATLATRSALRVAPQRWRFWGAALLASLAVVALSGALAGAQVRLPERALTVVFVLDTSHSVTPTERARAEGFITTALAALPPGDRAGLVLFGEQAVVARAPSTERTLPTLTALPGGARSNLEAALRLALALLPPEGQRRLVLLSDGRENTGDALRAARIAAAQGVPLDVLPIGAALPGPDAQITALSLPPAPRAGQRLRLVVTTAALNDGPARLRVLLNGAPLLEQQLALRAGPGELTLELPAAPPGFNRYAVELDTPGDVRPQNNRAATYSIVGDAARVLLLADAPDEARYLREVLAANGIETETRPPEQLPASLAALSRYDAVVLVNTPRNALAPAAEALLQAYVRDLGRGLAMVGGPRSLGAGGYAGTPIEAALPLAMLPHPRRDAPPAALVLLLDVSESMADYEGGVRKQQLAIEGARRIVAQLRDVDELTIIPFDRWSQGTLGPLPGSRRAALEAGLGGIKLGAGGINIYDGLQEAYRYLRASNKQVRHLITLADGDDADQQAGAQELALELYDLGVTTTVLAVGGGDHVAFLEGLARQGGGRFYLANQAAGIPTLLDEEARLVLRPYLIEEPFVPMLGPDYRSTPIMGGLEALPQLYGYVAGQAKPRAQVLLQTPRGDPLLATWQYGLGRGLVWSSDLSGRWGRELVQSPVFARLAAQSLGWLIAPPRLQNLQLDARQSGDALLISASVGDEAGRPASDLRVGGFLLDEQGGERAVALQQVAPGRYRALLSDPPVGVSQLQLLAADTNDQAVAAAVGGVVVANSAEYRGGPPDETLLAALARAGNGRVGPAPAAVFDRSAASLGAPYSLERPLLILALLLLPLSVALRRLRFGRRAVWHPAPQPQAVPQRSLAGPTGRLLDSAWLNMFGHAPFEERASTRRAKQDHQRAWGDWISEAARRRASGEE